MNSSAAGSVAPTLIVYPGQRLPQSIKLNVPNDWCISKSESGWINGEIFYEYFVNYFYKWVLEQGIEFPIVVFIDGHKSHLTYHLSKFCSEKDIILIALPPNCTHMMQPLDVSVFRPIKKGWAEAVHSWRMSHGGGQLTKYNFAGMLEEVFKKTLKEDTIKNGFKRCGLCPFDKTAVDYSKIDILSNEVGALPSTVRKSAPPQSEQLQLQTKPSTVTPQHNHEEPKECLSLMETFISPGLLQELEDTYSKFTPIWNGDVHSQDLYVVWKKFKDFVKSKDTCHETEESTAAQGSTTTSSVDLSLAKSYDTIQKSSQNEIDSYITTDKQETDITVLTPTKNEPGPSKINTPKSRDKLATVLSPETNGAGVPPPFKNNLLWPGTPPKSKKKTRQSSVKLPAVVSSKEWQTYDEIKKAAKKKEEDEKAERKRLREEKKKNKEKTNLSLKSKKCKKAKRKLCLIDDEDDDWICRVCKRRYSSELILNAGKKWIECDKCKGTYHYKCIPKKHLNTFGVDEDDEDDDDELAFMCHQCVSDSDDDPLVLSEYEDD